jgi:hypothetical protein
MISEIIIFIGDFKMENLKKEKIINKDLKKTDDILVLNNTNVDVEDEESNAAITIGISIGD